jgi:predicted transcriptional regulator
MITGTNVLMEALRNIPPDIQKQVDISMSISDAIAQTLSERGMSQKDFAKLVGKTETEVSRWLAGRHNFTIATIAKISTALGKDLIKVV